MNKVFIAFVLLMMFMFTVMMALSFCEISVL